MRDFMIYILQVNIGLAVFYLVYRILFVRDTHFELRRFSLLFAVATSFSYPFVSIGHWLEAKESIQVMVVDYVGLLHPGVAESVPPVVTPTVVEKVWLTPENVLLIAWLAVCSFFLGRLLIRLCSVIRLKWVGVPQKVEGTNIFVLKGEIAPFSFFGWIFVNPSLYDGKEVQEIIAHEKTHACQCHSFDVMMGEILMVLFWFNPIVWLILFEIRQNLEFLADRRVLDAGHDRKNYQYHLLRLSYQSAAARIINNFNVSQLKKRIMMMNKKRASRFGIVRYALLLPVTGILILMGNAPVVAQSSEEGEIATATATSVRIRGTKCQQYPSFPGGIEAMDSFFSKNVKYLPKAIDAKVQGVVEVKFTVTKEGKVKDPKIVKGIDPSLDKEVLSALKASPDWIPMEKDGKKINEDIGISVSFALPSASHAEPSVFVSGINTESFKISLKTTASSKREGTYKVTTKMGEEGEKNSVLITTMSNVGKAVSDSCVSFSYAGKAGEQVVVTSTTVKETSTPMFIGYTLTESKGGDVVVAASKSKESQIAVGEEGTGSVTVTKMKVVGDKSETTLNGEKINIPIPLPQKAFVFVDGKLVEDADGLKSLTMDKILEISVITSPELLNKYAKKYGRKGESVVEIKMKVEGDKSINVTF